MKRILFLFLLLNATFVNAQAWRHASEISLGYGQLSANLLKKEQVKPFSHAYFPPAANERTSSTSYGVPFIGYRYHPAEEFSIGVVISFEERHGYIVELAAGHYDWSIKALGFSPELTIVYGAHGKLKLYGGISFGIFFTQTTYTAFSSSPSSIYPEKRQIGLVGKSELIYQITPIGFRYGKTFGAFAEAGYGYKGIISGGLSLKLGGAEKKSKPAE